MASEVTVVWNISSHTKQRKRVIMNSSLSPVATGCLVSRGTETQSNLLMYILHQPHIQVQELNFNQMNRYFTLASADLVVPNQEAWNLLWDFEALRQLVDTLPGNTPYVSLDWKSKCSSVIRLQNKALVTANEIMNIFKRGDVTAVSACRKKAQEVFGKDWDTKGASIYDEGPENPNIWGIGQ